MLAIVNGTPGNDVLVGTTEDDTIDGLDGDDSISGGDGFDTIYDGPDDDIVFGDERGDTIYAGAGNDTYDGGTDQMYSDDRIRYDLASAGIIVDLRLSTGQVRSIGETDAAGIGVDTLSNFETIYGSNFDDVMYAVDDYFKRAGLHGGGGNDTLVGSPGSDSLLGDDGDDVLTGGAYRDSLSGGLGNDTFIDTAAGLYEDTIHGFDYGDRIVILDADPSTFQWSVSLDDRISFSFSGGSFPTNFFMEIRPGGHLVVTAAEEGGVQFKLEKNYPDNDFNGDGRTDLLWRREDGAFTEWVSAGQAFDSNDYFVWRMLPTNWQIVGTGDFNGDGFHDIIWRRDDGAFTEWLGVVKPQVSHLGEFASNDAHAWHDIPTSWHVVGTGDFNGDGRDDVIWRRDDGAFTEWLGQPDGGFVSNDTNAWELVPTSWSVDGTGDFDGDGRDDVIWRNDNGTFTTWLGQSNGGFVFNDANSWTVLPTSWQVVGTGDFNGDGRDDILWRHSNGSFTNWMAQAGGGFVSNDANAWSAPPTGWHVAATGDFDGDNRDDLIWRGDDGTFVQWLGQTNGGFTTNYSYSANPNVPANWDIQPEPNLLF